VTFASHTAAGRAPYHRGRFISILAAIVSLCACSVGPDYVRPAITSPARWQNSVEAPPSAPDWPSAGWWHQFNSLSLNAMMTEARNANLDIAAAVARIREADDQLRIAGAALLPTVNGNAGASRTRSPYGASAGPNGAPVSISNSFNLGLSASYEIDFWGKNRALRNAAAAAAFQSRFDMRSVQLGIQSSLAGTVFDLIGTRARLEVAHNSLSGAERILAAIHHQREGGIATLLDETQQESEVESERAAIPPLEQQIDQDRIAIALLLGKMPSEVTVPSETLDQIALPLISPGLPSELLARRPDVGSAEQQLIAANANIVVARAQLFPDITLTGAAGFQSVALKNLTQPTGMLDSIGSSLTQIVFDGGRLRGQVSYSRDRYAELLFDYRKAVISAFLDVEGALIVLQKSADEERAQRAYAEKASKANEISQRLLLNGMIDIVTLLNTQRTYYSAQDSLLQARLAHLQAVLGLYRALGGGWDEAAP
jgi:outer membrane protein, multidrug efflux system